MLNRADRALLLAKEAGRNLVVQLGAGGDADAAADPTLVALLADVGGRIALGAKPDHRWCRSRWRSKSCAGSSPITRPRSSRSKTIESLYIFGDRSQPDRRSNDRQIPLVVEVIFAEEHVRQTSSGSATTPSQIRTKIQVVMRPKRNRDRRQANAVTRARQLSSVSVRI